MSPINHHPHKSNQEQAKLTSNLSSPDATDPLFAFSILFPSNHPNQTPICKFNRTQTLLEQIIPLAASISTKKRSQESYEVARSESLSPSLWWKNTLAADHFHPITLSPLQHSPLNHLQLSPKHKTISTQLLMVTRGELMS